MDLLLIKKSLKNLLEIKDIVLDQDKPLINELLEKYDKILSNKEGVFNAFNISNTEKGKFKSLVKGTARRLYYNDNINVLHQNNKIDKLKSIEYEYCDKYYDEDVYNWDSLSEKLKDNIENNISRRFWYYRCNLGTTLNEYLKIAYNEIDKIDFPEEIINSYVNYARSSYSSLNNQLFSLIKLQIEETIEEQYPNIKEVITNKIKNYETSK